MFCCPNDSPSTHPLHTYTTPPFHSRIFKHNSVVQINKKDSLARIQPLPYCIIYFHLKDNLSPILSVTEVING